MWVKWTIIALCALNVVGTTLMVGKPRKPITAENVLGAIIYNTLMVIGILLYWR